MKTFKKLLAFSLLLIVAFSLVACSNDDEQSGTASNNEGSSDNEGTNEAEEVELTFWTFGATGYDELAAEYEEENPNVTVNIRTAENAEHHDALFTSLSAGNGAPDITMVEVDQFDRFKTAQSRFTNLYDLGAGDVQDQYLEWKWNAGENIDGDFLFGLPTDIGPKALYYRIDVFEEAGLPTSPEEVEELIDSPEAFEEAALQVKEETGKPFMDSMEMAYRAYLDAATETYLNPEGELILDEEGSSVKKAYDYAVKLNEAGLVGEYSMWTPEWASAVNTGDFAVELGAGWLKGWMEGNAPDASGQFRVATLPTEFAANWGGSYLTIPEETENAQEAYNFIEWLVSPENQLKSFESYGLLPSAPAVYEMEEFQNSEDEFFGGQATASVFAEAAQDIDGAVYKGENYISVNDEILTALQNVKDGADPEEEWEAAVQRAEGLVSR